jgi:hypothetical protein
MYAQLTHAERNIKESLKYKYIEKLSILLRRWLSCPEFDSQTEFTWRQPKRNLGTDWDVRTARRFQAEEEIAEQDKSDRGERVTWSRAWN